MNTGEIISKLRRDKGYNRVEFAKKIGIPPTTLRNYEIGVREPGHSFLIEMAKEFNVTTDYLLGLTIDPHGYRDKCLSDKYSFSNEAIEIAQAYDQADYKSKNIARQALDLPPLEPPSSEAAALDQPKQAV